MIQPWDSTLLKAIEKAIQTSDLGINPQNDGKVIRLAFPQLTVREQMAAYKEVIDRFPQAAERPRPEQGHTDR